MTCPSGKVAYRDHMSALLGLVSCQVEAKRTNRRQEARTYRCPQCRQWHLTSKTNAGGRELGPEI